MQLREQSYPEEARHLTPGTFGLEAGLAAETQRYLKWLGGRQRRWCLEYTLHGTIALECLDERGECWSRRLISERPIQAAVAEATGLGIAPALVLVSQSESLRQFRQDSDRLIDWFLDAAYTGRVPGYLVYNLLALEGDAVRAYLERNVAPYYDVVQVEAVPLAVLRFPAVPLELEGE